MAGLIEVPHLDDLRDFGVVIDPSDQPAVVSLTASANDGDTVTLTWDELARSVCIRWLSGDRERLLVTRETASKVSVRDDHGVIQFLVWSRSDGLGGELVVRIADRVSVRDTLLQI